MKPFNNDGTSRAATGPTPTTAPNLDNVLFWPLAKPPQGVTRFLDDKNRVIDLAAKPGQKSCTFKCTWDQCEEWLISYRDLDARARWPKYCWLHKAEARRATWRKSKQRERDADGYLYTEFVPDDHDHPVIVAEDYLRHPREASPEARAQARAWLTNWFDLEEPLNLDDDLARALLDTSWKFRDRDEAYKRVREANGYKTIRIGQHHSEYSVGDPLGPRPPGFSGRALSIDPVVYPRDWSGATRPAHNGLRLPRDGSQSAAQAKRLAEVYETHDEMCNALHTRARIGESEHQHY